MNRVIAGYDGSPHAGSALAWAAEQARRHQPLGWGKQLLAGELAGTGGSAHSGVIHGHPADILTRHSRHADLLVLGAGTGTPPSSPEHHGLGTPMELNEVLLPGVGVRYEFVNADGIRIGIVAHRVGDFEIVGYRETDPDECMPLLRLTADEADTVAEILGAPRIAERLAGLTREAPGLSAGQITIPATSPHAGQPLSHTRARTRTGASIVAVIRGAQVIASPTPAEVLYAGDTIVVIGTHTGIDGVRDIIQG